MRRDRRLTLAEHISTHGPLPAPGGERRPIAAVAEAGLRGRGGSGAVARPGVYEIATGHCAACTAAPVLRTPTAIEALAAA